MLVTSPSRRDLTVHASSDEVGPRCRSQTFGQRSPALRVAEELCLELRKTGQVPGGQAVISHCGWAGWDYSIVPPQ